MNGNTMGTTYHITYIDSAARDFSIALDSLLMEFNTVFSTYDTNSVISAFNRSDTGIALIGNNLEWFSRLMQYSDAVYHQTGGAFNPAIAPLVQYWGFYNKDEQPDVLVPQPVLDSLLVLSRYENVYLDNQFLKKRIPEARLDVNAIAPGFACDLLGEFLESKGIERYLVEIGGEVRAHGLNARGLDWSVGIMQPEEGANQMLSTISLHNQSLATSGNYNKYVFIDGKRLGHTINPFSGQPALNELLSATVIAKNGMMADAYATACMVLGFQASRKLIDDMPELEGYLIYSDQSGKLTTWYSEGLQNQIKAVSNN